MNTVRARIAVGVLGVVAGVLGVVAVRDATLSTHEPAVPGSSVDIVVSVARTERIEGAQSVSEMIEALVLTCRLEVPADLTGPIRHRDDGQLLFTLTPSLDKTDRRQFRGCIEDWTIDQILVDIVSFEDRGLPGATTTKEAVDPLTRPFGKIDGPRGDHDA